MRHATIYATILLYDWSENAKITHSSDRKACDWEQARFVENDDLFDIGSARTLLYGRAVPLPTCPACAALVDLAAELGGR